MKCIDDEIPFDIPQGWEWTKMKSIAFVTKLAGFEYTEYIAPNLCLKGIPLFKGKNIQDGNIIYEFEGFIPEELSNSLERSQIRRKCLLTPYVGTIGNVGLHNKDGIYHLGSNVGKIELLNPTSVTLVAEEYIHLFLTSQTGYDELSKHKKATAQESISIEAIRDVYVPIPPVKIQEFIVDRFNRIAPILSEYAECKSKLDSLNKSIFESLKKSILQEGIQGKLVPQIESEGTAEELLEEIRVEKHRLVKEGKLKKSAIANESRIFRGEDNKYYEQIGPKVFDISEEIPFDIPFSWRWCRIGSICQINPKNDATEESEAAFIPMELINPGFGSGFTYQLAKWKNIKQGYTHFADGDIAFAKITPCFQNRKSVIFNNLPSGIGAGTTELKVLRPFILQLHPEYILAFLQSPYFIDEATFKGTANQQRIISGYLESKLFPLPPLEEQKRIAQKLQHLNEMTF